MSKDSSKTVSTERHILPEMLRFGVHIRRSTLRSDARISNKLHHSVKPSVNPPSGKDASTSKSGTTVPWNPVLAVVVVLVIYFASQIVGGLVVSIYPALRHWSQATANAWVNNSVVAQFVYVALAEGLTVWALWLFLRRYKFDFGRLGLRKAKGEDVLFALGGFAVYFVSYAILLSIVTKFIPSLNVNQPQQVGFQNASGFGPLILTAISLVILPPLVEEILMRGFLYTSLRKSLPKIVAALVTSIIFASGHLEFGEGAPLLWVAAIDTFVLSLVLVYLREKTGRLWASMGLHGLKNAIAFVSLFVFHVH